MSHTLAYGAGLVTVTEGWTVLDAWFPAPGLGRAPRVLPGLDLFDPLVGSDPARGTQRIIVRAQIDLTAPPKDAGDSYLRLHLLSHRLVEPNGLNLDGIFGHLANVVWTSAGPCEPDGFEATRAKLLARGPVQVLGVDKFPPMTNYVVPSGVRIADAARVRLGAHLAPGTTVMHEGFCNFNAGTLGTSMVEGRISQGVVVEDGADVGGGASIMGTLSGGGTERIRVGARSLLGANSGLGISLGADCVVEAGLYLTAGTKVELVGDAARLATVVGATDHADSLVVKARQLSGLPGLEYRRDSLTGAVQALARQGNGIALNPALHAN